MIELSIGEDITQAGISVTLGWIDARVDVRSADQELGQALDQARERRLADLDGRPASTVPRVIAARRAYKALGKDPARYRPAAEALIRRLVQGKGLYRVNNVVDVNNLLSISSGISIGAYDAESLAPPVVFRRGGAGETYAGIGRGPVNLEGLPIFADADGPFGSPTSDAERSKITETTRHLLMVLIGFGEEGEMDGLLGEAATLLIDYCAAEAIETGVLSVTNSP